MKIDNVTACFTVWPDPSATHIEIAIEGKMFRAYRTKNGWGVLREAYAKNVRKATRSEPNPGSQKDQILKLLKEYQGEWVPLWKIMALKPAIARYNTRIIELRHMGYDIENRTELVAGGRKRKITLSEYRLNK